MAEYSREFDHLGEVSRILGDLTGYDVLVNELVQNADDDPRATTISFAIEPEALYVRNDGQFTDCGRQDLPKCPNRDTGMQPCDFHGFRSLGGRNKDSTAETTGAFGIGFTAVYQITDQPEIASNGRHWVVDETAARSAGIRDCSLADCAMCREASTGTTFRFPWAFSAESVFRRETSADPVPPDVEERLESRILDAAPLALLFLRNVQRITVTRRNKRSGDYQRVEDDGLIIIRSEMPEGSREATFLTLNGDFNERAERLRQEYGDQLIRPTRDARVSLAVPLNADALVGRFYATLPTDEPTALPVHVNADFFPTADRRRLNHENYRGRWNAAAIAASAEVLAADLLRVRDTVGAAALWRIAHAAHRQAAADRSHPTAAYWAAIVAGLASEASMLTTTGGWARPQDVFITRGPDEEGALSALAELGIQIVAEEVAHWVRQGLPLDELGLRQLTFERACQELERAGMEGWIADDDMPPPLSGAAGRHATLTALETLASRLQSASALRSAAGGAAILPCSGGWSMPGSVFQATDAEAQLLDDEVGLVRIVRPEALPSGSSSPLLGLCAPVKLADIARSLKPRVEELPDLLQEEGTADRLLEWMVARTDELTAETVATLRALPFVPTPQGLSTPEGLELPGGFSDEAGVAQLTDVGRPELAQFLKHLGAKTLTFERYLTELLPPIAIELADHSPDRWLRVVHQVIRRSGEIMGSRELSFAAKSLPLVPDGKDGFSRPGEAYLPSESVRDTLGSAFTVASLDADHRASGHALFAHLGAESEPRPQDLLEVLDRLHPHPGDGRAREHARKILMYVGRWWGRGRARGFERFQPLATRSWLPAEGDLERWHAPDGLFTIFAKPLVDGVGPFLEMSWADQVEISDLLDALGLVNNPETADIVEHLLMYAAEGRPVSRRVYVELDNRARREEHWADIRYLRETPSLLVEGSQDYIQPSHVFSNWSPFGGRRWAVGDGFTFPNLLRALEVEDGPDHEDAVDVLVEIATDYERFGRFGNADDPTIAQAAWGIIQGGLDDGVVATEQLASKLGERLCIPTDDGVLVAPAHTYFDDSPHLRSFLSLEQLEGLVPRGDSTWRAQRAAGARSLSEDAHAQLVELEGVQEDASLGNQLTDRWSALARVLDAQSDSLEGTRERLEQLRVRTAETLEVRYVLRRYPQLRHRVHSPGVIIIDGDEPTLFSTLDRTGTALARELVRYLVPGTAASSIIPAVRLVLDAESERLAHDELDAADIPRLLAAVSTPLARNELASLGGTDDELAHDGRSDQASPGQPGIPEIDDPSVDDGQPSGRVAAEIEDDAHSSGTSSPQDGAPDDGVDGDPVDQTVTSDSGSKGQLSEVASGGLSGATANDARTDARVPSSPTAPSKSRTTAASRGGKLRSYVLPADHRPRPLSGEETEHRSKVDHAGVAAVLAFERLQGRDPERMPHENPGFDIRSTGRDGAERIIEVKSIGGSWSEATPAAVSSTQFDAAQRVGGNYWLYVVEHSLIPSRTRIWMINDPAAKVDQFMFDDGWRETATPGTPPPPVAEGVDFPVLGADPGEGSLAFFDLSKGVLDAPVGYLESIEAPADAFAVALQTVALEPEWSRGQIVMIVPQGETATVEGDVVLAWLTQEADPETGLPLVTRTCWMEGSVVSLGGGNGVAPIVLETPPQIVGRVEALPPHLEEAPPDSN